MSPFQIAVTIFCTMAWPRNCFALETAAISSALSPRNGVVGSSSSSSDSSVWKLAVRRESDCRSCERLTDLWRWGRERRAPPLEVVARRKSGERSDGSSWIVSGINSGSGSSASSGIS